MKVVLIGVALLTLPFMYILAAMDDRDKEKRRQNCSLNIRLHKGEN